MVSKQLQDRLRALEEKLRVLAEWTSEDWKRFADSLPDGTSWQERLRLERDAMLAKGMPAGDVEQWYARAARYMGWAEETMAMFEDDDENREPATGQDPEAI